MYQIGNEKVWCGDFHGQWCESPENLPLNLAALTVCGHDFSLFNSGDTSPEGPFNTLVKSLELPFLVMPYGRELMYDWAHIMVGGLRPDTELPGFANPDFKAVLKELRTMCDFISVAHPYPSFVKHLDMLIDEELIDSVAFIEPEVPVIRNWLINRLAAGKITPIVAELDFHVTKGKRNGLIHYQTAAEANEDLRPVSKNYTLIFAEELTTEAIYAAVRAGRSCVDINGELYGAPELVEKLIKGGYFEQKAAAQQERESLRFELDPGVIPLEGETFSLNASRGDRKWRVDIPAPVNKAVMNRFHIPVTDGSQCRSIQVSAAQELRILPGYRNGKSCAGIQIINNSLKTSASGSFSFEVNGKVFNESYSGILPGGKRTFYFPVDEELMLQNPPVGSVVKFAPPGLPEREIKRDLLCTKIPYSASLCNADWMNATPMLLNRSEQLEMQWVDNWGGPEDSSADIRMLWNEDGLHLRAEITDTVLAPSNKPRFLFMGDSLQIGINPFDNPSVNLFSFYHFLSTRGGQPDGAEYCRMDNVPEGTGRIHRIPPFRLPESCYRLTVKENSRSTLELTFPWNIIPLINPEKGSRFQLHFILWDNDGSGLKASLHWPNAGTSWYLPTDETWASAELC